MLSFIDPSFWFNFLYFTLVLILACFIPGDVVVSRLPLTAFQRLIIGTVVGLVLWSFQGFILGYIQLRWLTYLYLTVFIVIWIKQNFLYIRKIQARKLHFINLDKILVFIVLLGTLLQLLSISLNGAVYKDGLFFCCGGPDIQFHTALTNHLISVFPPNEPGVADIQMKNYHFLYNLSLADIIRIFRLPLLYTQWFYIPFYFSLLIGLSAIVFAEINHLGNIYKRWLVFFLYFSGDIMYIFHYLYGLGLNFKNGFLQNAVTLWVSPSRVYGLVIFFVGISLLVLWIKHKDAYIGLISAIVLGSLSGFKIYVAFIGLCGYGWLGLYLIYKKQYRHGLVCMIAFLVFLLLYVPVNSASGGLTFSGMWRFQNFIAQQPPPIADLELQRLTYQEHNNWFRIVQYGFMYMLMYIIFVFGTINLAFLQTRESLARLAKELHIFLLSGFIFSALFGFFFVQNTGGANSVQFLISLQMFGPIYAALVCSNWDRKIAAPSKYIITILIILLTIPRMVYESSIIYRHIIHKEGLFISNTEIEALNFIRNNTLKSDIILQRKNTLIGKDRCIYISFMTDRKLYVCDDGAPEDRGVYIQDREKIVKTIYSDKNLRRVQDALRKSKADYIYLYSRDKIESTAAAKLLFKPVFSNKEITVMKAL